MSRREASLVITSLQQDAPNVYDDLSEWELQLIDEIDDRFGRYGFSGLRQHGHELPEYAEPGGTSLPIDPRVILRSAGWSEADIRNAEEDARAARAWAVLLHGA